MRILGVAFVMYVLSYIDRTNIAMAIPAMRTELGISASAIGVATGMFFWGYIILQIPAGRLASVWSAKWVILGLLLFWSLVSFSTAFVRTENQLIANRFILGLFEGGVLTCTIVLIRKWFTRAERARANTMFLISIPIASVIANPISGIVLAHFGWQMMFIVEALPGLVWALVWIRCSIVRAFGGVAMALVPDKVVKPVALPMALKLALTVVAALARRISGPLML